jgi:hypothetical protein
VLTSAKIIVQWQAIFAVIDAGWTGQLAHG